MMALQSSRILVETDAIIISEYTFHVTEFFFLYYNGILTPEIRKYFAKESILLLEWNFNYWNRILNRGNMQLHAQIGQIHHALCKYGKVLSEYMIFCDYDEYFFVNGKLLFRKSSKQNGQRMDFIIYGVG
jgi:hypothetical protein